MGAGRRWTAALCAVLMAALGAAPAIQPAGADEGEVAEDEAERLPHVGGIRFENDSGDKLTVRGIAASPQHRVLAATRGGNETIHLADLDSLEATDSRASGLAQPLSLAFDEDPASPTLFVGGQVGVATTSSVPGVAVLDLSDPDAEAVVFSFDGTWGSGVVAVALSSTERQLYALVARQATVNTSLSLHALDTDRLRSADASVRATALIWSYSVPGCAAVPGSATQPAFLGHSDDGFLYLFCQGQSAPQVGQAVESAAVRVNLDSPPAGGASTDGFTVEHFPVDANLGDGSIATGDGTNHRLMIAASSAGRQMLFVFDAAQRAWVGATPLTPKNVRGGVADPATGRIYITQQGIGALVTDGAALPVPQGTEYELAGPDGTFLDPQNGHLAFDPVHRHLFLRQTAGLSDPNSVQVYEDRTPLREVPPPFDPDAGTTDMPEGPGAAVNYGGEASAYGARALAVGGLGAFPLSSGFFLVYPDDAPSPNKGGRELLLGWAENGELRGTHEGTNAASADAVRAAFDAGTQAEQANFPPPPGPVAAHFDSASCSSLRDEPQTASSPGATVACDVAGDAVTASAAAAPTSDEASQPLLHVANATSDIEVSRTPDDGVVSRAEASAEGVSVTAPGVGSLHLGEVRSVAWATAKGVPGSAQSDFAAEVNGARIAGPDGETLWACDSCAPLEVATAANRFLSPRIAVEPGRQDLDPLVVASPGGAKATVVKDPYAEWNDRNVNNDVRVEVPALVVTVYHDTESTSREVLQLAGVLVDTGYTVNPLPLIPDPSLAIKLLDEGGKPLAGGSFQVTPLAGSAAALPGSGACTTGRDGVGDCQFTPLPPGSYTISQTAAPAGLFPASPFDLALDPGFEITVEFVNIRATGAVEITLTDVDGNRLAGGEFAVHTDAGDGAAGPADRELARCTTDTSGFCGFGEVPLGSYVVSQVAAPAGLAPSEPVAFAIEAPGQTAELAFVNAPPFVPGTDASGDRSSGTVTIRETTIRTTPIVQRVPVAQGGQRGLVPLLVGLPADLVRFAARNPAEAALVALLFTLFGLPAYLAARRRHLQLVKVVM